MWMEDEMLLRLEGKLDTCLGGLYGVSERLARIETSTVGLPSIQLQITDHEVRVSKLEALDAAKVDERLDKIEHTMSRFWGWIGGATAVVGVLGGAILWYLNHILAKFPVG